jgi:hypothetical protein
MCLVALLFIYIWLFIQFIFILILFLMDRLSFDTKLATSPTHSSRTKSTMRCRTSSASGRPMTLLQCSCRATTRSPSCRPDCSGTRQGSPHLWSSFSFSFSFSSSFYAWLNIFICIFSLHCSCSLLDASCCARCKS